VGTRIEQDSMGSIEVDEDRYWGAQTQRSRQNFRIGEERMPDRDRPRVRHPQEGGGAGQPRARASSTDDKLRLIVQAADEVIAGTLDDHFPLVVWQTGLGHAEQHERERGHLEPRHRARGRRHGQQEARAPQRRRQHVAVVQRHVPHGDAHRGGHEDRARAVPGKVKRLRDTLAKKSVEFEGIVKIGRTHLQDATPLTLGQEISGWVAQLDAGCAP
jgi:fumarate hydratase class II